MAVHLPIPAQQVDFAQRLFIARQQYFGAALSRSVAELDVTLIDRDLKRFVPKKDLAGLASNGIRGEWVFATPTVLKHDPHLVGYYRLLLGYSQKEFYTSATGLTSFRRCEDHGVHSPKSLELLDDFCRALVGAAAALCQGIGYPRVSLQLIDSLALLTYGPQLRGGANNRRGFDAIRVVMNLIEAIAGDHVVERKPGFIGIKNSSGRLVEVRQASDPDIVILEVRRDGKHQSRVAIEVKGGTDFSNIHNRVGEAEKSHQKARKKGFTECWTVVNVGQIDLALAKHESPSTDQFFRLGELMKNQSLEHAEFVTQLVHLISIPDAQSAE